jgi:hypothetical protein
MNPAASARLTAIFSKHPTPGKVKTRLTPPLTPLAAARLAEAMLRDTVARTRAGAFRSALVFSPPEEAAWFRSAFPELEDQRPQVGAGLGERLASFVARVFAGEEAQSVVVVGSDQPLVPGACVEEAHRALEDGVDLVLGPDLGGGYYLIGLRRSLPELFTGVRMSSGGMYAATLSLARARGLEVVELAPHPDVDLPEDLERLCRTLAGSRAQPGQVDSLRHTRRVLEELALLAR